jgi:hypothetical protein
MSHDYPEVCKLTNCLSSLHFIFLPYLPSHSMRIADPFRLWQDNALVVWYGSSIRTVMATEAEIKSKQLYVSFYLVSIAIAHSHASFYRPIM